MLKMCFSRILILCFLLPFLVTLVGCTPNQKTLDKPDRLGSLGSREQINQNISRAADWQQIVLNSQFQLGEKTVKGSWFVPEGTQDYYEIKFGTYPSIDGSTVAVPMAVEFARQHLLFSDEVANDFAAFSTTHEAYVNLITKNVNPLGIIRAENTFLDENHSVDLIIATEPSADELNIARQHNVTLIQKPVCYDAFVFITHKDNPVDSLTIEQIRDIYSGKITNWQEVGGKNAPITAYQREENSGSQTAMINLVMQDTPMLAPEKVKVLMGMGMLVDTVAEYQNNRASIGYTYKYYIDTLYKNEKIKTLKIENISPEEENLRAGLYPLVTCYYGVIRSSDENSSGGIFLDWMLSEEGQRCIKQAGYIPYIN